MLQIHQNNTVIPIIFCLVRGITTSARNFHDITDFHGNSMFSWHSVKSVMFTKKAREASFPCPMHETLVIFTMFYMFLAPLPCFGCWNCDFRQIPSIFVIFSGNGWFFGVSAVELVEFMNQVYVSYFSRLVSTDPDVRGNSGLLDLIHRWEG